VKDDEDDAEDGKVETNLDDLEQALREKALRSLEEAKQLLSR